MIDQGLETVFELTVTHTLILWVAKTVLHDTKVKEEKKQKSELLINDARKGHRKGINVLQRPTHGFL